MIILRYDANDGLAVRDGDIGEYVMNILTRYKNEGFNLYVMTATANVIDAFRMFVANGDLDSDHIEIRYGSKRLKINKDGSINHWPKGFCDLNLDLLLELTTRKKN